MRPRWRARPRGSVRSSTPPPGLARRASASPALPPAPSGPGTGGSAPRSSSCRDQSVVAGQGPDLHLGPSPTSPALPSKLLERSLVGGVGEGQVAGEGAAVAGRELAAVERDRRDLALGDPDLDSSAGQTRVERVVVGVPAQVGLGGDACREAAVEFGHRARQRAHPLAFGLEPLGGHRADAAVKARVGALRKPAVELVLVVELRDEAAGRLEAALEEVMQALERPLCLAVARIEDDPADPELPAEGGELRRRLTAASVDRALAVPDHPLGQRAELRQAAAHPPEHVGGLLGEDERRGAGAGVARAGGDYEAASGLAVADGDLLARLPEVELDELAGPVAGALEGARRGEDRSQLAHVVVQDRLAAPVAGGGDPLADHLGGNVPVVPQKLVDLRLERIELGGPRRPRPIRRRPRAAQRRADRVARVPGPPRDLLVLSDVLCEVGVTDLACAAGSESTRS